MEYRYSIYDPELDVKKHLFSQARVVLDRNTFLDMLSQSAKTNQTQIDPNYVSRKHCAIDTTTYPPRLRNLSRKNPTCINGTVVLGTNEYTELKHGDVIRMGPWGVEFIIEKEEETRLKEG